MTLWRKFRKMACRVKSDLWYNRNGWCTKSLHSDVAVLLRVLRWTNSYFLYAYRQRFSTSIFADAICRCWYCYRSLHTESSFPTREPDFTTLIISPSETIQARSDSQDERFIRRLGARDWKVPFIIHRQTMNWRADLPSDECTDVTKIHTVHGTRMAVIIVIFIISESSSLDYPDHVTRTGI